nr:MAG TPA: hypothetical protein [Caudoviricetes sp.]
MLKVLLHYSYYHLLLLNYMQVCSKCFLYIKKIF